MRPRDTLPGLLLSSGAVQAYRQSCLRRVARALRRCQTNRATSAPKIEMDPIRDLTPPRFRSIDAARAGAHALQSAPAATAISEAERLRRQYSVQRGQVLDFGAPSGMRLAVPHVSVSALQERYTETSAPAADSREGCPGDDDPAPLRQPIEMRRVLVPLLVAACAGAAALFLLTH